MINVVWILLLVLGVVYAMLTGDVDSITIAITEQSTKAVSLSIGLIGIMSFWLGMMKLAEESGLLKLLSKLLRPLVAIIFPEVPSDSTAMGSILMNIAANLLGLGNVATPLGLKAMSELQKLNPNKDIASNAMCTLLALNTSGLTLVPTTVIAVRIAAGSTQPTEIIGTTIVATGCSTLVALSVNYILQKQGGLR